MRLSEWATEPYVTPSHATGFITFVSACPVINIFASRWRLTATPGAVAHVFASPVIPLVQRGTIQPDHFGKRLSEYGNSLKQQNEQWLAQQFLSEERRNLQTIVVQEYHEVVAPSEDEEEQTEAQSKDVLTLAGAWNMYKRKKPKTGRRQFHRPMSALWKSCSLSLVHQQM